MNALRPLLAVAFAAAAFFALYEVTEAPASGAFAPVVTHGSGPRVALTFDDGPTGSLTPSVLDTLERAHVRATFFVVGRAVAREPQLLRRMAADGDEIENHSYTHAHLNALLSRHALDDEIARTDDAVRAVTGRGTHWLRPPYGARDAAVLDAARRHGMRVALWSAMLGDTPLDAHPAAWYVDALLAQVHDGAIVVLHDGHRGLDDERERAREARFTPAVIAALRARGYRFVTLDALVPR